jgi:hypothetical protein
MDLLPRLRANSVDLSAILTFAEAVTNSAAAIELSGTNGISIRTNLAVAVRVNIPTGSGVFLLDSSQEMTNGKRIGFILSVRPPAARARR